MAPRTIKIKQEERALAKEYLKKAADNHDAMVAALRAGNGNAAGTLAIQCAISSADALCVHEKGIRSISQDHYDVCDLVSSIPLRDANEKAALLRRIISKKNLIQYECRTIRINEAEEIVKSAIRLYQWVASHVV